jgi:hypothetical protein
MDALSVKTTTTLYLDLCLRAILMGIPLTPRTMPYGTFCLLESMAL